MRIARELFIAVVFFSFVSPAQDRLENKRQSRETERKRDTAGYHTSPNAPLTRNLQYQRITAEESNKLQRNRPGRRGEELRQFFSGIQEALLSGRVGLLASHLGSHVTLNLRDGENGLFSSKQAYYVLENYLQNRRILYLELSPSDDLDSNPNPYATGSAGINIKGSKESMQVYVAVTRAGDKWVITQITFS